MKDNSKKILIISLAGVILAYSMWVIFSESNDVIEKKEIEVPPSTEPVTKERPERLPALASHEEAIAIADSFLRELLGDEYFDSHLRAVRVDEPPDIFFIWIVVYQYTYNGYSVDFLVEIHHYAIKKNRSRIQANSCTLILEPQEILISEDEAKTIAQENGLGPPYTKPVLFCNKEFHRICWRIAKEDAEIGELKLLIIDAENGNVLDSGISYGHTQITTSIYHQTDPAIYNIYVVWQDLRNGNWDIYGYNLAEQEEVQITDNVHAQEAPALYQNVVVWQDLRNGNWDIYGYNLETCEEFPITLDESDQYSPALSKNVVVWTDERHAYPAIYGYNLETCEEFCISSNTYEENNPVIHGDTVAWIGHNTAERDAYSIHVYSLSTGEEIFVSGVNWEECDVAVYGNTVVWSDKEEYGDTYYIYQYDLTTRRKEKIVVQKADIDNIPFNILNLSLFDTVVLWESEQSLWDGKEIIYAYDFATHQQFEIVGPWHSQKNPAFYQDFVVWQDARNGNWDIYGCSLSEIIPTETQLAPVIQYAPVYGLLIVLAIMGGFLLYLYKYAKKA